ncbi:MAG: AraC family transcriptional regulator [Armatimonadetes bacterium]|nr:AraC family transcriptional regulator [Akkermansiaceae bacterium]
MNPKRRFFRYLPAYAGMEEWGARVLDAGFTNVLPGAEYPAPGHPEDHHFSWENGRRLSAYTFIYITSGAGVFESEASGTAAISAGNVFVLFPGVWHRFRPLQESGWDEYWVECEGSAIDSAVERIGLEAANPVIDVGHDDAFLRCFLNILETVEAEPPGFEAIVGLRSLEIIARLRSLRMIAAEQGFTPGQKAVKQSILKMRENLGGTLEWDELAKDLGMSYSSFRRVFRKETGLSPGSYFIEMKMNRARQLLASTGKTIQEISDLLGFESVYYFSRLFKARNGMPPSATRKPPGAAGGG